MGGDTPFRPSAATLEGLHSLHIPGSWLSLQETATPRAFKTLMSPSYSRGTHNSHRPFRRMFTQLVPQSPGYQLGQCFSKSSPGITSISHLGACEKIQASWGPTETYQIHISGAESQRQPCPSLILGTRIQSENCWCRSTWEL